MKCLRIPEDIKTMQGSWITRHGINVTNVHKRDIYFSLEEPSYVSWAILWKERSGALKLSFVEVAGDKTAWPPTYNFNSRDIEYYLKTLVSTDGGDSWRDTGWREDLDPLWERNPDHHIRHVFEFSGGTLIRNYCHTIDGVMSKSRFTAYDETKENSGNFFPFSRSEPVETYPKFSSIWTSADGGKSWKEIFLFDRNPPFFIAAIHALADGSLIALGAFRPDETDDSTWTGAFSESKDGGKTWSDPVGIVSNDDRLNPQGLGEECDVVELDDGRLLVIWRTDAPGCMRQLYLERNKNDKNGAWQATRPEINHFFPHSGYPYMHRATDGTIFYYCHTSIKYSCDNGKSWSELLLGHSYYGQLTEVSPGRMLAVTQKNIGDCSYPWKHDTSMLQTTFNYKRTGIAVQESEEHAGALAVLDTGNLQDFHIATELTVDAASGIAYQLKDDSFRFAALSIPANRFRLPECRPTEPDAFLSPEGTFSDPHNAFLQIGKHEGGRMQILRKIFVGKIVPGAWAELQISRKNNVLKAAVNLNTGKNPVPVYTCFKDENPKGGSTALFTSRSTGSFRNVRFAKSPESIRANWFHGTAEASSRIAIDAGQGE